MKKIICIVLIIISFSVSGCQSDEEAYDAAKIIFNDINTAYETIRIIGRDIQQVWYVSVFNDKNVLKDGMKYLNKQLSLTEDELVEGMLYNVFKETDGHDENLDIAKKKIEAEENKELLIKTRSYLKDSPKFYVEFSKFKGASLHYFNIQSVVCAYYANGDINKAQTYLDRAKNELKSLEKDFPNCEVIPILKEYYTAASSMFALCKNPNGTALEEFKEEIKEYNSKIRDYHTEIEYYCE